MINFITGSQDKFQEAKAILPDLQQLDIDLPEIQEIDPHTVIKSKLEEASKHGEGEYIVEDTSLYLDCLNGLPGPLIKWFMKTIGNEGLVKIVQGFENNKAQAKTVIGYTDNKGEIHFFEGVTEGQIISPRGSTGFGWDPIFQPVGHDKTFAEMSTEEKNSLSMRRLAFEQLRRHFDKF